MREKKRKNIKIAAALDIKIRWGGDWNRNNDQRDERFRDLGHFKLVD